MTVIGTVREWNDDDGWGVVDSAETPGGCWVHFSHVRVAGLGTLTAATPVHLDWEPAHQDGFAFRATRVGPVGQEAVDDVIRTFGPSAAYSSRLEIRFD